MTNREALLSVVERLDDDQIARLLGYADALAAEQAPTIRASVDVSPVSSEAVGFDDDLTRVEPRRGFAPGSGLWELMGFIKDDGPTDMAENHDTYLAEAYGDRHEKR